MSANSSSKLTKEFKQKSSSTDSDSTNFTTTTGKPPSNCPCNNISIMQLFHEMKQKFPTVPDNIVNECATENCHNRDKCIAALEKELIIHPNTAQSYPSQAIRNNGSASPLLLRPIRPAPLSPSTSNSSTSSASNACDNVVRPQVSPKPQVKRPTTLDIVKKYPTGPAKPIRRAPPLPPNRFHHQPPPQHDNQSTTTSSIGDSTSSLTSPSDFSDSLHSPSTSASASEHNSFVKRLGDGKVSSYVHFNPEPAYTQFLGKTISPTNPKSFTSVNFSLRPPSDTPQNPIEIQARPDSGLSYSSVSFNPREGLKNQLQIHVNDKCGQFTISQIQQRTSPIIPLQPQIMPPSEVGGYNYTGDVVTGHIMRQRKQRDKLAKAVAVAEQQFKQVQEEILYLESPFDPEELERLDTTISLLRKEIQYISNLPDNSSGIDLNGQQILSPHQYFSQSSQESSPTNDHHRVHQPQSHQTSPNINNHNNSFNSGINLDDETGPPWTCRSCTFQNHALLQKCETCDTVRVLPGTIRITSSTSTSTDGGSASSAALASFLTNNDTPPFALHT